MSTPEALRRVVWAPKAKQDLRHIWRYFARVASPDIADNLLREIRDATQRLAERPLLWRPRDDVMPGLRAVLVHPYTVFYRVTDSTVEIVRVLHERRDFTAVFSDKRNRS
jgi:plasmid stabilization system protein ParE